jgi:16S rRNA (adenine(1408)-N(1))-methyltransferase
MTTFERILGKKKQAFDPDWLRDLAARFDAVVLDIGTGDGRFVIEGARANPSQLWIGLDPVAENMAKAARTAAADPRKGGLVNAVFLRGAAEQLPGPLAGIADRISINYPWGSLLRTLVLPDLGTLKQIVACGKPGTEISIYLNYSIFEDRSYLQRLGLADVPDPATGTQISDGYVAVGCAAPNQRLFTGDPPFRSQWGRQLVRGSGRKSLLLETRIAGG